MYNNILTKQFWIDLFETGLKTPVSYEASRAGQNYVNYSALETSHKLKADEIEAIRQTQSKGFRVIDIDPNALTKSEFFCVYDDSVLSNIFGPSNSGVGENVRIDSTAAPTTVGSPRPYFRTVELGLTGNFLKIEFLPARAYSGANPTLPNPPTDNPLSITPQNTDYLSNTDQYKGVAQDAGKRMVLVDFETPTASPLIAEHGTVFKTYFSNVFITFKQLNVRIRITIGFNSEIEKPHLKENTLAHWGGNGLTDQQLIHPIPFNFNIFSFGAMSSVSTQSRLIVMSQDQRNASGPYVRGTFPRGIAVCYITGFSFGVRITNPPNAQTSYGVLRATVVVGKVMPNNFVLDYTIKNLCTAHLIMKYGTGGETVELNITEPIRVSLRPGEGIFIIVNSLFTSEVIPFASLRGYSFGNFLSLHLEPSVYPTEPYVFTHYFKEHPFPQDLDTAELPRNP